MVNVLFYIFFLFGVLFLSYLAIKIKSYRKEGLNLNSNQTYNISFWAKASVARPIEVKLQGATSPYTSYLTQVVNPTTSWQQFNLTFTPSSNLTNVFLGFNLAYTTGGVWIDNAVVR